MLFVMEVERKMIWKLSDCSLIRQWLKCLWGKEYFLAIQNNKVELDIFTARENSGSLSLSGLLQQKYHRLHNLNNILYFS